MMLLLARRDIPRLKANLEEEKERLLREFKQYFRGNIDIRIHENHHLHGRSLAADLLVNGEVVREYDPADLCFLDLNELMLKRIMENRRPLHAE